MIDISQPGLELKLFGSVCLLIFVASQCAGQNLNAGSGDVSDRIIDAIGVKRGMVIGEAGAGEGFFAFKLAEKVGEDGFVYANDINGGVPQAIRDRCKEEGVANLLTVRGTVTDALFPREDLEMVYMRHVLHCMEKPLAWLKNLRKYLRHDAELVIVECDPDIEGGGWKYLYKRDKVVQLACEAGFALIRIETFLLPNDYIYIFQIKASS